MRNILPEKLKELASLSEEPLYVVGGAVRDFLLGNLENDPDFDLSSPMEGEKFGTLAERCGFQIRAVYKNTGTVKIEDGSGNGYEFTQFRSDHYVRGLHTPAEIEFTRDIQKDARRRDFCANAVYYDVKRGEFCDPLGGIEDIKQRKLRTVAPAEKVFGEDGLRLLRLARIAGQIGFTPDEECMDGAKRNAALIRDISPERIFTEMKLLLHSDLKHREKDGPYRGLQILHHIDVLKEILPELALGEGMKQRADFHDHDVLEHSLRCVRYSDPKIRFAALLHDVGKPLCSLRDGNFHLHPEEGEKLTYVILGRWKAPKKLTEETARLVRLHMRDYNLEMKESKLRRELAQDYDVLDDLLLLKQADFSACKDDLREAPCVTKWRDVLRKMREEGCPLTISELKIGGDDVLRAGVPPKEVGEALQTLFDRCLLDGKLNEREKLLEMIR